MDILIYNAIKKKSKFLYSFDDIGIPEDYVIDNNRLRIFYRIFRDLDLEIYQKFFNNLFSAKRFNSDYELKRYISYYANRIIDRGFSWRFTPEGFDYWQNINNTYVNKYHRLSRNNT